MTVPSIPEAMQYTVFEAYYGYSVYQDLACRLFIGFLLFDTVYMCTHRRVLADPTFGVFMLHHVLFGIVAAYALSGSYFRYASASVIFSPQNSINCLWDTFSQKIHIFVNKNN